MIELFQYLLITSLFINGLYLSAQEGMLLHKVTVYAENFPDYFSMPFITCPTCMASVWGIASYLFYFGEINPMMIYAIPALAFVNSVMIEYYYFLKR